MKHGMYASLYIVGVHPLIKQEGIKIIMYSRRSVLAKVSSALSTQFMRPVLN